MKLVVSLAKIVTQPKEKIREYVSRYVTGPFENYSAMGLERNGVLECGIIYNHYSGTNICMHIAAEGSRWMTREILFAAFDYPFNQLGVRRITGLVPSKNIRARRFDEHIGFRVEGVMRHALPDDDMIVYGMLLDECRWLRLEKRLKAA